MRKLVVAVTANQYPFPSTRMNQEPADYAPRALIEALLSAGLLPIILPVHEKEAAYYVSSFDGLVIPGGSNMSPCFYGEEPLWCIGATNERRDRFEMDLIHASLKAKKPILGICRGLQVINVALGGSLWQDMQVQCKAITIQHMQKTSLSLSTHSLTIKKESRLYSILGDTCRVNSFHKEGVKQLGRGLSVSACSPDGCIEAFESKDDDLIHAVQWHPEYLCHDRDDMARLFTSFAKRVERYALRQIARGGQ